MRNEVKAEYKVKHDIMGGNESNERGGKMKGAVVLYPSSITLNIRYFNTTIHQVQPSKYSL